MLASRMVLISRFSSLSLVLVFSLANVRGTILTASYKKMIGLGIHNSWKIYTHTRVERTLSCVILCMASLTLPMDPDPKVLTSV